MRLICPDCIAKQRTLLLAKESLSLFVHANGRRCDREVRGELRRLVNDHVQALQAWEAHISMHRSGSSATDLPGSSRAAC